MKKNEKIKKFVSDYIIITIAAFVYGFATSTLIDPNNIAPGGFTGIAITLNRLMPIGTGVWFMILNVPVILLGIWKFGIRFVVSTIYATAVISFGTDITARFFPGLTVHDMFLGVVFGSAFTASAMGVIFKHGATTGGSDIIVKILRKKYPHIRTGMMFFLTDLIVVIFAGIVFENVSSALYSLLAVIITSSVLDVVLYGRDAAKLIFIISDRGSVIAERILKELDVGATYLYGKGAYSSIRKDVIMCVVRKRIAPMAENIVKEEDPDAFMIVTSATEIFGEGYKSYFEEKI